jgi:ABC-2 type transport system ATP-binding protein
VSAPAPAIRVENLTKRYDGRTVVAELDLVVRRGEILALLGPNGAGKTTTIEVIEGYRRPDAGSVSVLGLDPVRDARRLRSRVGVMPQRGGLYSLLRPIEALELFAAFFRNPLEPEEVLKRVGLVSAARSKYRDLSRVERQRLSLGLALVGRSELLILDEPTAAMDARAQRSTWDMLLELRASGTTILVGTHSLEEADLLADRVAILDRGRLVALGTPAELRRSGPGEAPGALREVRIETAAPLDAFHVGALGRLSAVVAVRIDRPRAYVVSTASPGELLVELGEWLWAAGVEPVEIRFGHATLEDVFLRLTNDPVEEARR